ncbi:MAG TPA: amino acid adenylation domain-containing protein, partial [Longimicrobium sp.]
TANRGQAEIEGLIGFFVNTLALRMDLSGAPTVADLLARVRASTLGAQQHQDIPFEQVVEIVQPARSLAYTPLFQVLFAWQSAPRNTLHLPGLTLDTAGSPAQPTARLDLSLTLEESDGRVAGGVTYATALFDEPAVRRIVGYFRAALQAMVADEHCPVARLPMLSAGERSRVVDEWNDTDAEFPRDVLIHELFEAQVERAPDAVAVVYEGGSLTYAELNARANGLAHHLRGRGVGPDARVAVCVERGPEMVVALLGVLKAGGAYVPLDPSYPEDRLRYMLDDSGAVGLLTPAPLAGLFPGIAIPVIDLDPAAWASQPTANPRRDGLRPENLAYVIYTSGSTGMPKGVMNGHAQAVNLLAWAQTRWELQPDEALLQRLSFSFDVSVREFFWPLSVGARIVVATGESHRDPDVLIETLRRERIAVVHMVPSLLQVVLEHPGLEQCTALRRVMCGGEAVTPALVARFHERLPNAQLYQAYGPTETTVGVTARHCLPEADQLRVPLGRATPNSRIYLLDSSGEVVPTGVAGEMY